MTQHLAVIQQVVVPGPVENCWKYLSDPRLVSEWFADTDQIELQRSVHFAFGDGDYFSGTIVEVEEPTFIRLTWKFMNLGAFSEISFFLCPLKRNTEVTVVDRGEYTAEGVTDLREGWGDFLSRLERRIRTGENSRYRWSPDICIGALVQCDSLSLLRTLRDLSWWRAIFPESVHTVLTESDDDDSVQAIFEQPAWSGRQTQAVVEITRKRHGIGVSVKHTGWAGLPQDLQLDARRQFAALWQEALLKLERRFGINYKCPSTGGENSARSFGVPPVSKAVDC
jgi:uncharacterized protein YndB with AHSA1/START domain